MEEKKILEYNIAKYDKTKNYAIEASAGTGKTYSIISIIEELVEARINLDEILVVTFTEKAAEELKNRLRKDLYENFPNLDFDNAPVFTFHSFCKSLIDEFWFTIKNVKNLSLIDESASDSFIEKYVRQEEILKSLHDYNISVEDFIKKLKIAIRKYYLNFNYDEDENVIKIKSFEEIINKLSYKNLNEFKKIYPEVDFHLENLKGLKKKYNILKEALNNVDHGYRFKLALNSIRQNNTKSIRENNALSYFRNIVNFETENDIEDLLVFKYLGNAYKEWQQEKIKNKTQTFSDMIRTIRENVVNNNKALIDAIRSKYKYAIIDEFQDTNQLQWDIFKTLFLNVDNHHIIVVGDPKQSIYAFQDADVSVYQKALNEIENNLGILCSLTTNYRATSNLIETCNHLFESGDGFFKKDGLDNNSDINNIIFYPSKSPKNNEKDIKLDGQDIKSIWLNNCADKDKFAEIAVQKIIELTSYVDGSDKTRLQIKGKNDKDFRNVSFNDFVILARTRTELPSIIYQLKRYGIPFIQHKNTKLFESLECAQWASLLEAINEDDLSGNNINYFKKALFTKFFDRNIFDINDDFYNKYQSDEFNLISKWKECKNNKKWESLINSIFVDSGIVKRMADKTQLESFSKFKQLGDFCLDHLKKNNNLDLLIKYLYLKINQIDSDDDEENGDIVAKNTNLDCVQIMTIHASKGLQFPIVISVAGIKGKSRAKGIYKEVIDGKKYLTFDSKVVSDSINKEFIRLFYVDFTRASHLLIIPVYEKFKPSGTIEKCLQSFIENCPNDYLDLSIGTTSFQEYKNILQNTLAKNNKDKLSHKFDEKTFETKLQETKKEIKNNYVFKNSYSSLSHENNKDELVGDDLNFDKEGFVDIDLSSFDKNNKSINTLLYNKDNLGLTFANDFPKGSSLGTTLHEIFELYDFKNNNDNVLVDLIKSCLLKNGFSLNEEWIDNIKEIVKNVLKAKLPVIEGSNSSDQYFSLNEICNDDKLTEVEFNYKLTSKLKNYFNGFVDLIFRRGEYYSVLDWKSDSLNDLEFTSYSDFESLKKHVDKNYSIQRVLYSFILIEWLKTQYKDLSEEQIFEKHFGGIYYVFLRGCNENTSNGIYAQTWNNYRELKNSFDEILKIIGGYK